MRMDAQPHTPAAEAVLQVLSQTLDRVHAQRLIERDVQRSGDLLFIQGQPIDLSHFRRVLVYGSGKASVEMARGLALRLGNRLSGGFVVTGNAPSDPSPVDVLLGGHPLPDEGSLIAGDRMLREAAACRSDDLVLYVLSGGSSALLEAPIAGIELDDLRLANQEFLASGYPITAINEVRSAMSRIKNGGLARAFGMATVFVLILSDIVGPQANRVGSAPFFGRELTHLDLWRFPALPSRVVVAIEHRLPAPIAPAPPYVVIGSASLMVTEAADVASGLGFRPLPFADPLAGEARLMSQRVLREVRWRLPQESGPVCMIWAGETTVHLGSNPGKGGRAQEMVVAAAARMRTLPGCCFAVIGSDGFDGPTEAAGGFADELTCERAVELGLDPRRTLRAHASFDFLDAIGGLIRTGPTGTNVNDLAVFLRVP